ncbi:tubulin polyglutamylase TTLL13-like [Porphyrio hochstetteri]
MALGAAAQHDTTRRDATRRDSTRLVSSRLRSARPAAASAAGPAPARQAEHGAGRAPLRPRQDGGRRPGCPPVSSQGPAAMAAPGGPTTYRRHPPLGYPVPEMGTASLHPLPKPEVPIRRAAQCCGLREVGGTEEWTVCWMDNSVSLERIKKMKRFQKINHFPGMMEICHKDLLARNLKRMLKLFPEEYNIFPRTWCLPADYGDFQAYRGTMTTRTFICKPCRGSQGKGIFITRNPEKIKHNKSTICQQYISKPFLIDGFKFDLRVYVLVTSCDPLRIFIYKEGLALFATTRYIDPSSTRKPEDTCMHLTNYAINKRSENFVWDDAMGSKRKLSSLFAWMTENSFNMAKLWEDIEDLVIKTLIAAHPIVKHLYRSCFPYHVTGSVCFGLLGFDIFLDRKLKPWLLEVNHSPSLATDTRLDCEVTDALLCDTISLINVHGCDKGKVLEEDKQRGKERLLQSNQTLRAPRREELESKQAAWLAETEEYENSHLGGFRCIYPACGTEKYEPFFKQSSSLFLGTAASKASARQQLEKVKLRKGNLEALTSKKKNDRAPAPSVQPPVQYNTMQPQDIVEKEEKERREALLRRENLIRRRGIVAQLSQWLPTAKGPADTQRSSTIKPKGQMQRARGQRLPGRRIKAADGEAHSVLSHSGRCPPPLSRQPGLLAADKRCRPIHQTHDIARRELPHPLRWDGGVGVGNGGGAAMPRRDDVTRRATRGSSRRGRDGGGGADGEGGGCPTPAALSKRHRRRATLPRLPAAFRSAAFPPVPPAKPSAILQPVGLSAKSRASARARGSARPGRRAVSLLPAPSGRWQLSPPPLVPAETFPREFLRSRSVPFSSNRNTQIRLLLPH